MIWKEIESVIIVGGHSKAKAGSAIGRGAVGAALLGPVGLLAAASAKKKNMASLLIRYKDGTTKTEDVKIGSSAWNLYAPYIKE